VRGESVDEAGTVLDQLADEDRRELEARGGHRRFKAGSTLMHEGSPSSEVLLLLRGRVKVTVTTAEGREVVLQFCGPGDLIGELSVIDGGSRSATAEALESVEALAVSAVGFRAMIDERPGLAGTLLRSLVRRFRDADRKRIEFAAAQTLGRVAVRLVELVDRYGEPSDAGIAITLPISQEELAGWTGSSREAVAKALHTLRSLGLIRTQRRHIVVLDEEALRRQAP
jgi:CRP/FNR family transcriptional regulator, cyclic AMP receptor protein